MWKLKAVKDYIYNCYEIRIKRTKDLIYFTSKFIHEDGGLTYNIDTYIHIVVTERVIHSPITENIRLTTLGDINEAENREPQPQNKRGKFHSLNLRSI